MSIKGKKLGYSSIRVHAFRVYDADLPVELIDWIDRNATKTIRGFEHKKNAKGQELGQIQQLNATQQQLLLIATDCLMRGKSTDETLKVLSYFLD